MALQRIPVSPDLLIWARNRAGLDRAAAAKKLGVSQSTLAKWEDGALSPTIGQLRKTAHVYGWSLAVLLLPERPADFDPVRDFRRLPADELPWSAEMHKEFRRALEEREVILELAEVSPESVVEAVAFPEIERLPVDEAGLELRQFLGLVDPAERRFATPNEALNRWIAAAESRGIVVIQTQGIAINEVRGFSIGQMPHPVIALNGSDWPRPRLFTLLHEAAHLALRLGGVCDLHETRAPNATAEDEIEHLCNAIAASALIPTDEILGDPLVQRFDTAHPWTLDELAQLARRFPASSETLLLRLVSLGRADWDTYWLRKPELEAQYIDARAREVERARAASGGPSYYVVKARDIGHGYASAVLDAYHGRRINGLDAADYLGLRYSQLPHLEAVVR